MTKRILFVDDEPMVLKGLERSLRSMRNEWEMQFVCSGAEALEAMARAPFDVVISDMRMPGMDGAQLLDLVKERFSQTVRMVLSGQSDRDAVFRAIRPTHQYLSKPCNIEELKQKLKCALALRDVLESPELKQKISQIETVPSLPLLHEALRSELESDHPNLHEAAEIASRDPGMTAKLLQLVNSAYLGPPSRLSCPKQAISVIGLDNLRCLALSNGLFSVLPQAPAGELAPLWEHAYATARFAGTIARSEQAGDAIEQNSFAAGLLYDIGWIVIASTSGDEFAPLLLTLNQDIPNADGERRALGGTHGQIGAYLLGLWGLPDAIVDAVAWAHAPSEIHPAAFCPLIAVHVADHFARELHPAAPLTQRHGIDESLLEKLDLLHRLPVWRKQCQEIDVH